MYENLYEQLLDSNLEDDQIAAIINLNSNNQFKIRVCKEK